MSLNIRGSISALGGLVMFVLLVVGFFCWMEAPEQQERLEAKMEAAEQEERFFEPIINTGIGTIIVDRETGVCYYFRKYMNAGGMTVLLDADGNPLIWEEGKP